jgi:hypothetical protein
VFPFLAEHCNIDNLFREHFPGEGATCLLLHGPREMDLIGAGFALASALGYDEVFAIPEHVEACCDDLNKVELIRFAFNALDEFSKESAKPACVIFPAAETAVFRKRSTDRAITLMVSELVQRIDTIRFNGIEHLVILCSSRPWEIDPILFSCNRISEHFLIPPRDLGDAPRKNMVRKYLKSFMATPFDRQGELTTKHQAVALLKAQSSDRNHENLILFSPINPLSRDPKKKSMIPNLELHQVFSKGKLLAKRLNASAQARHSPSEAWELQFYRCFVCAQPSEDDFILLERLLLNWPLDFNHWSKLGMTLSALIIAWLKHAKFSAPDAVFEHMRHTSCNWLLNYWPTSKATFTREYVLEQFKLDYSISSLQVAEYYNINLKTIPKKHQAWIETVAKILLDEKSSINEQTMAAAFTLYYNKAKPYQLVFWAMDLGYSLDQTAARLKDIGDTCLLDVFTTNEKYRQIYFDTIAKAHKLCTLPGRPMTPLHFLRRFLVSSNTTADRTVASAFNRRF